MVTVTVFRDKEGIYRGFRCEGHAGYAKNGSDIVCAAVSLLTINTVNAIEKFTENTFSVRQEEEKGLLVFSLDDVPSEGTRLLFNTMILGISEVEKQYTKKYVTLKFREV